MNLLIIAANWYNHGDESAVRSMISEFKKLYPDLNVKIHFNQIVNDYPDSGVEVLKPFKRLAGRNIIKNVFYQFSIRTNGLFPYFDRDANNYHEFIKAVKWADYAIYAPGGPSIGDYYEVRKLLLDMIYIIIRNNVPFSFYAPSMGPFNLDKNRIKKIMNKAEVICFREEISKGYFESLHIDKPSHVTLDAAFQGVVDFEENELCFNNDSALINFMDSYDKIVGITVTDLKWHKKYRNTEISDTITQVFQQFVDNLTKKGYGILFIPQLFGKYNDSNYMSSFVNNNCFVMNESYDCYFQQYIISKLYAVVGMRYHSNIFSAKMGTPFISIAYEQKMSGFMEKAKLEEYCIPIEDLSIDLLNQKFVALLTNYDLYKNKLKEKSEYFHDESYITTRLVSESIDHHVK